MDSGDENEAAFWRAEAGRLAAENDRLVARDAAHQARILDLEALVAALSEKVATLAKLAFGEKSEKSKAKPPPEDAASVDSASASGTAGVRKRGQRPGSPGHGRRDYSKLVTEEVVHDVAEEERCCPECKAPYKPFVRIPAFPATHSGVSGHPPQVGGRTAADAGIEVAL